MRLVGWRVMWRSLCVGGLTIVLSFAAQSAARAGEAGDARYCRHFSSIREQTAPALGRMIDPITRLASVDLRCSDQVLHFKQELVVPEKALNVDWLKRQREYWTASYCKPGSPAQAAIHAGWTVATTITTADGARHHFTARCDEAMAAAATPAPLG